MSVLIFFGLFLWIMGGTIWLVSRHQEELENLTFSGTLYYVILWPISIWNEKRMQKGWKEFIEFMDKE